MSQTIDAPTPDGLVPRRPTRMAVNIPTDLLRSFLAIVDTGSMAQATEAIFLTQSALSLQMKRLEDLLQQRVFHRQGRSLTLTAAGEELVGLSRELLAVNDRIVTALGAEIEPAPLQIGMVQDFADTMLPGVLAPFTQLHPRLRLRLRLQVGGSAELVDAFESTRLDLALFLGHPREVRRGTSQIIAQRTMVWVGEAALAEAAELPLVLLEPPCAFRSAVLERLEAQHRHYRIVLETPSLPGLVAAVRAGIGLSCRTEWYARALALPVLDSADLPALPAIDHVLLSRFPATRAVTDLARLLREEASHAIEG